MYASDDLFTVATPELVEFGYEVAGVGSRFIAALVDTVLITVIYALIQFAGMATSAIGPGLFSNGDGQGTAFVLGLLTMLAFVVLWGYYVFFETLWNGQTPGKRLTHLRVVRDDSTPIGFWEALIRNLVRLIDFLPLVYTIGVIVMVTNGRARRLGDFAAGTLVVREGGVVSLAQLRARTAVADPTGAPDSADAPLAALLEVRRLTPADLILVREVLARAPGLAPSAAWQLLLRATQVVAARTGYRGPIGDPQAFLLAVLRLAAPRPVAAVLAGVAPEPAEAGSSRPGG